ncbi:MAG: pilus assembly protein [Desulfobacteraceae bacterium]
MMSISFSKNTVIFLVFFLFSIPGVSMSASNSDYAALPPFISADAKANVLFVMDYSGSMQGPANYGTVWHGYSYDVANYGNFSNNINVSYDKSKIYFGYFDTEKYYKYNSLGYWEIDENTSYTDREIGSKDSLSGNFLNFILMSRVDVSFKSLFGGYAECPEGQNYCILKPKGAKRSVTLSGTDYGFYIRPVNYDKGNAYFNDMIITLYKNYGESNQQKIFERYANVKIDKDQRKGIIQENFDKVRFGFIAYANSGNSSAKEGLIKYGLHQNDESKLISAFEDTLAYNGTHTGEALKEAYYYLTQDSSLISSYNSGFVGIGTSYDPYYQKNNDGIMEPAWCRKTYVVLISDGEYGGSQDPDTWAHKLHSLDLRSEVDASGVEKLAGTQNADVYSLFAFSDSQTGENSMKTVAAFGKYNNLESCSSNTPYEFKETDNSLDVSFPRTKCNPGVDYDDCCKEWDKDKDGVPDSFFKADDGEAMAKALTSIFEEIRQGTSSGTAVTALTSRISSGSAIAQAAFYPEKEFENEKKVQWTSDLVSNWYLNDYIKNASSAFELVQNIREDTNENYILDIEEDRILDYLVKNDSLKINAYDSNEYGTELDSDPDMVYSSLQDVKNLFDCGENLKNTKPEDRKIYGVDKDDNLKEFKADNSDLFKSSLGTADYNPCLLDASGAPDFKKLISYTRGRDYDGCRTRATDSSLSENVWKLGDITYSSPTIVSYDNYSVIYVGSNSGMLHAFRLGYLRNTGVKISPTQICDDNSVNCTQDKIGIEEWAFVPKDAMPYLRFMASPEYDHLYTVDMKPYIINTGSQTILIGGMRFGGGNSNGSVNPPLDTAPVGRSAYFALDISDPKNPKYLWRYAPDGLGFSYSGPAYVKRKDADGNYKHFVMFASGPTGYDGTSVQNLKVFTVDLLTGSELNITGDDTNEFNIKNAFGGRLFTDGFDVNDDGQTDFVFLGYTDNSLKEYELMGGGVIKIYTGSSDPAAWNYDTSFLTGSIGNPVTGPVVLSRCFSDFANYPYLYFGTGRYFVPDDDTQSNSNDVNYLYGVPFSCDAANTCKVGTINKISNATDLTCDDLLNVNTKPDLAAWKVPLKANEGPYLRERCYSDPAATDSNIVFFNTSMPTNVICECGGQSRSWALNCATGQGIFADICPDVDKFDIDSDLKFKYLIQLSRGDIQDYGEDEFNNGATDFAVGVAPPSGGLPTMPPKTTIAGKMLYWKQW